MKNKTAIFLGAALAAAAASTPTVHAGGVVIRIGGSFGVHAPGVYGPPVYAAPVHAAPAVAVPCAPAVPVYCPPPAVVYSRPVCVAPPPVVYGSPYYVPPSARFGYGYGLFGRPRYCGWY